MSDMTQKAERQLVLPLDREQQATIFNPPAPVEMRADVHAYPRLKTLGDAALPGMVAIVLRAMVYRGQKANDEDAALTAANLLDELIADRDKLRTDLLCLSEIWYAVRKAVLGQRKDGKEMYGVNVASLYMAITDYVRTEGRDAHKMAEERRRKAAAPSAVETRIAAAAGEFGRKARQATHL